MRGEAQRPTEGAVQRDRRLLWGKTDASPIARILDVLQIFLFTGFEFLSH